MKVACVVPSAGKGKRLGSGEDKPFMLLGGKPILAHTLGALDGCKFIDNIVLVASRNKLKTCGRLVKKYKFRKVCAIVPGGKKRFDSVKNGLSKVKDANFVLIHDGARPFISRELIKKVFVAAKKHGAALCATASKQTLKSVNKNLFIKDTPERKFIWEAQTPQAFKKSLITKAYKKSKNRNATDDSYLVEKLGHKVKIVKGSYRNIKITTPEDLTLARVLIKKVGL
ncbi:MAG: 2-C-methyl-D-erythritol 4-phosphate cytidylyltransferase [Candidatus Omnitrophica bacterium]|nr:2-C-methyl-D-erythritol 4-phosphate cytidylyltransferase [Candidatus Omnitrophota bacterium]